MFCSRCGEQVDTSSRFCPRCGQDLTALTGAGKSGATAPMTAQPPQENETELVRDALKDEYELEKELGRGGMAVVYKARDKQLDREVAIKVLPFSLSFDAEFVERFQREARTAGKLEHPNIIPIYRVGKSGRVIFFVMKYIRGKSLSGVIENRGALPVAELKRMLTESAGALGYAHKHGIVHRDIKPDNIMFDELGQAIVADFGIAKAQSGAKLTGTGMSIGTPHYMSPEQARAQNLDGRSDLYSLGVVAYQCLTGHVPFDGEDSFSIGYKHIMEELPIPSLESAEQREIFPIIQKMMAKKPDDRYQTADEVIRALEGGVHAMDMSTMPTRAMEPLKPAAKPAPPMTSMPTTPLPRASASMGKPKEASAPAAKTERSSAPERPSFKPKEVTPKKSSLMPVGIAALLILALGGLGYWKFAMNHGPQQVAAAPPAAPAPGTDSSVRDTSKAAHDTSHAAAPAAAPAPAPPPAPEPPRHGTSRTPGHTTTPPPAPVAAPAAAPASAPANGPHGTIAIDGNIPNGAQIKVDGNLQTSRHFKVPAGQHNVEIVAQG
ncbi:MAG TPA: serine/threonine-protein kinase, partial [Gemmatimonadales bacterium]